MIIIEEIGQQRIRTGIGRCLLSNLAFLGSEVPLSGVSVEAMRRGIGAAYNDVVELVASVCVFAGKGLLHQLVHCVDRKFERYTCTELEMGVMPAVPAVPV